MALTTNKGQELSDEVTESYYEGLSDKAKEVAPQIEKLLKGLSYFEIEQLCFAIMKASKKITIAA